VSYQAGVVLPDAQLLDLAQVLAHRERPTAAVTADYRGHALPQVVLGGRAVHDTAELGVVSVGMQVNEARRNDQLLAVNDRVGVGVRQCPDRLDAVAPDAYIRREHQLP